MKGKRILTLLFLVLIILILAVIAPFGSHGRTVAAQTGNASGGCTAREVYPAEAAELDTLRDFRDQYLMTNPVGEAFVDLYYKINPPIAEFIADYTIFKPVLKVGLYPAVAVATVATNIDLHQKIAIGGLLALIPLLLVGGMVSSGGFHHGRRKR